MTKQQAKYVKKILTKLVDFMTKHASNEDVFILIDLVAALTKMQEKYGV